MKLVIEVDEYKKLVPGYNPDASELYHSESAKLADKDFEKHIKSNQFDKIIFMAGGVASGKTEFVSSFYMESENILIYDGTMKNIAGFKIKYKNIKKYQNNAKISVVYIIPHSIEQAYQVFLNRDRKMSIKTFMETHINSKLSVVEISTLFTDVVIEVYANDLTSSSGSYQKWVAKKENIIMALTKEHEYLKNNLQKIISNIKEIGIR